jgi:hypothetical protein
MSVSYVEFARMGATLQHSLDDRIPNHGRVYVTFTGYTALKIKGRRSVNYRSPVEPP